MCRIGYQEVKKISLKKRTLLRGISRSLFTVVFPVSLEFSKYFTVMQVVPVPVGFRYGETGPSPDVQDETFVYFSCDACG